MTRANLSLNKHGLPQKEILRHRKVPVVLAILVMAMFYIVGSILVLISNKDVETLPCCMTPGHIIFFKIRACRL